MSTALASVLISKAAVAKEAELDLAETEVPTNDTLQEIAGDPHLTYMSTFAQLAPFTGANGVNPLSPTQGDEIFWAYFIPGAVFLDQNGQYWELQEITDSGRVILTNWWHPRIEMQVSVQDVRRSIQSWVEPIQQAVPPPPPGTNYDAQAVRIVE